MVIWLENIRLGIWLENVKDDDVSRKQKTSVKKKLNGFHVGETILNEKSNHN